MKKRSILVMLLLSIITCGIYNLYWHASFQSNLKTLTNEGVGGFLHLLLLFITFGIYGFFWSYLAGKRLNKIGAEDHSVIYLLMNCFIIGAIINPYLMQAAANKLA